MRGFGLIDTAFVARIQLPVSNIPQDTFESYSDGAALNGLNGGSNGTHTYFISWQSAYVSRGTFLGLWCSDSFETYSDGAALDGLNGQTANSGSFTGAYVNHDN